MTGPKALYSRSQRKAISATVIIGGELPYSLYQVRYFAGYCLSALKRLSIRHSERYRLGLEEEEVVWIRYLLYETSWNSLSNGTHLFASTLSIFKRHSIACIERVYARSFKHMDYHPGLSCPTLSRCYHPWKHHYRSISSKIRSAPGLYTFAYSLPSTLLSTG